MAKPIPFLKEFDAKYGVSENLSPLVRRVLAQNPGPFTAWGSGTYLLGHGDVAIIDPGPDLASHVEALLDATKGERVSHIVVTHPHLDHNGAVEALRQATLAPVYGFDDSIAPDTIPLHEGDVLRGKNWTLDSIHTPGHSSAHLCFALKEEDTIFTGDHVMGWSTSVITPPDGKLDDYLSSLEKLIARPERLYRPTHGAPIENGPDFARLLLDHRHERTTEIIQALSAGLATIPDLVRRIYVDLDTRLYTAAGASIRAHLLALIEHGKVAGDDGQGFHLR